MTIVFECGYEPPHDHEYADDWKFGGADGLDPRADERFRPTTYTYYDSDASILHVTQVPLCDDQALDEFTKIAGWFPTCSPTWLSVKRPDEKMVMLPWTYDKVTDMLNEVKR